MKVALLGDGRENIKASWGPQKLEDYNQTRAGKESLETYTPTPKVPRILGLLSPRNPPEIPKPRVPKTLRYRQRTPDRRNP